MEPLTLDLVGAFADRAAEAEDDGDLVRIDGEDAGKEERAGEDDGQDPDEQERAAQCLVQGLG